MENLFNPEKAILQQAKMYIEQLNGAKTVEADKYIELYNGFEKYIQRTTRAMRISDKLSSELNSQKKIMTDKAYVDELTNVYNRRYMGLLLESSFVSAVHNSTHISVLLLDIDCFKQYNDFYGHPQGDSCLQDVAAVISAVVSRTGDVVARYGGEEFLIILPGTDSQGAVNVAQKIIESVQSARMPHQKNIPAEYVTVSLGVTSCIPDHGMTQALLVKNADIALYQAKETGRNRYIFKETVQEVYNA